MAHLADVAKHHGLKTEKKAKETAAPKKSIGKKQAVTGKTKKVEDSVLASLISQREAQKKNIQRARMQLARIIQKIQARRTALNARKAAAKAQKKK